VSGWIEISICKQMQYNLNQDLPSWFKYSVELCYTISSHFLCE